jgi:glycosyltransferase involved in cell wall biosynthesis
LYVFGFWAAKGKPYNPRSMRVSVLLPYRQCEATIEEAVCSVLEQRGVDSEVIAVDDGSTDSGPARVARLAARHRGLVALSTGGTGAGSVGIVGALCAGLAAARGEVIARMDGDDVSEPDRLARQLELLASDPGLGVVGTQVAAFPQSALGEGMARYIAWQNQLVSAADHARELFIEAPLCHPSAAIRRAVLDQVGPWRECEGPEDYDLWLRVDAAGWSMAKVPAVLFHWRHHAGRATFRDPRYGLERFRRVKAPFLARRVRGAGRPLTIWGAGATGKRLARALEQHGVRARRFIDIDPRKIGRMARGVPVVAPDALRPGQELVVAAVGARGARDEIRARLHALGLVEGSDFVCAA